MDYLDAFLTAEDEFLESADEGNATGRKPAVWTPAAQRRVERKDAAGKRAGSRRAGESFFPVGQRPGVICDRTDEEALSLYLLPSKWLKRPERLPDRLEKLRNGQIKSRMLSAPFPAGRTASLAGASSHRQIWYSPTLRRCLGWQMGLPEMGWMRRAREAQPFCPHMTVILPDLGETDFYGELEKETAFLEEFLGNGYERLNGLLLVSRALEEKGGISLEEMPYFRRIYEETGLAAGAVGALPAMPSAGSAVCIDLRPGWRIPFRALPERTRYLDMTSEPDKERLLYAKRKDISYVSALNFLDTYVRKRYNTFRCKLD